MSSDWIDALASLMERVATLLREDVELRECLDRLGRGGLVTGDRDPRTAPDSPAISAAENGIGSERPIESVRPATEHGSPRQAPEPESAVVGAPPGSAVPAPRIAPAEPPPPPAALLAQRLWQTPPDAQAASTPERPAWRAARLEVHDEELRWIEARLRLKADAARWAARRPGLLADAWQRDEVAATDREIIARAKSLPDCFLWMSHPSAPSLSDPARYELVAGCFDAAASAVALAASAVEEDEPNPDVFDRALGLLAEAQSALHVVIAEIGGPPDSDQKRIYAWLKDTANTRGVFVRRHLRSEDPADPAGHELLTRRIAVVQAECEAEQKRRRDLRRRFGKLRFLVKQTQADGQEDAAGAWQSVFRVIEELIEAGVPPSSLELREPLLELADDFPDSEQLPPAVRLVQREIERFLASRSPEAAEPPPLEVTPEIAEVRRLLGGKGMVLIGGQRRPHAHRALEQAFGLDPLIWIRGDHHRSVEEFEPYVARPDVALVVLAIRWSSHSFADVRAFCERYGKPLVRLPSGYNPSQVAAQILAQSSARLAGTA